MTITFASGMICIIITMYMYVWMHEWMYELIWHNTLDCVQPFTETDLSKIINLDSVHMYMHMLEVHSLARMHKHMSICIHMYICVHIKMKHAHPHTNTHKCIYASRAGASWFTVVRPKNWAGHGFQLTDVLWYNILANSI